MARKIRPQAGHYSAAPRKQLEGELGLKERWYPIKVKQKDKAGRPDIDAFEAMMMREDCDTGFIVSFDYSSDAMTEIGNFFKRSIVHVSLGRRPG